MDVVPPTFSYKHEHVRQKHLFTSWHVGHNTKSVFCHSLSRPGHVLNAFAFVARLGAQYSSCSWMYNGQTRPFMSLLKKIGYVSCFPVGCGEVWVAINIVYCPVVHHGQVTFLDLEKFYPILPSKLLSLIHCSCLLVEIVTVVIVTISHFLDGKCF